MQSTRRNTEPFQSCVSHGHKNGKMGAADHQKMADAETAEIPVGFIVQGIPVSQQNRRSKAAGLW